MTDASKLPSLESLEREKLMLEIKKLEQERAHRAVRERRSAILFWISMSMAVVATVLAVIAIVLIKT